MGRYKGLGMPRAKKKKLDAARAALLEQVSADAAGITVPQLALEPAAAVPAAREPTAADTLKQELQDARQKARMAGWIEAELAKDVQSAKRSQSLKVKVAESKMSQWSRENKRSVKSKRPSAEVQLVRVSKIEDMLYSAAKEVWVAKVVAGMAGLMARDAEIAARDARIRQLLARVRQLKK